MLAIRSEAPAPRHAPRILALIALCLLGLASLAACGPGGASNARIQLRDDHIPRVKSILREDIEAHRVGVRKAAKLLSRGFVLTDLDRREREMRRVMQRIQEAPRGIGEFVFSPMAFLAAVGADGVVIARDMEPDPMKGQDFGQRYPLVHQALAEGRPGHGLAEFPSSVEGEPSSWSMIFVHPVFHRAQVAGAIVAGIPLWRWAQRATRQIRVERAPEIEEGLTVWAYLIKGDRIFHYDTPPDLDAAMPPISEIWAGLERSPGGFTGELQLLSRWYAYGAIPLEYLGDDMALLMFRADPMD
ncbi:MAG: hypothetical protein OEY14_10290 [Myxococcales bacterium]|nr:hypothetical protein [Myxococcales bacterium]